MFLVITLQGGGVRGLEMEVQRHIPGHGFVVFLVDGEKVVPLRRVHLRVVQPDKVHPGMGGFARQGGFKYQLAYRNEGMAFQQPPQLMGVGGVSGGEFGGLEFVE